MNGKNIYAFESQNLEHSYKSYITVYSFNIIPKKVIVENEIGIVLIFMLVRHDLNHRLVNFLSFPFDNNFLISVEEIILLFNFSGLGFIIL